MGRSSTGRRTLIGLAGCLAGLCLPLGCAGVTTRSAGGGHDAGATINPTPSRSSDAAVDTMFVIGSAPLGDAACATSAQQAQRLPLDMYIMMDSSSSMFELTSTGQQKWDAVKAALTSFLQDPMSASAGLGVGIQYFPLERPGVPASCETDAACGASGPCTLLKSCDMTANVTPCNTNRDCPAGGGTCVRLGTCGVSGGFCTPTGALCSLVRQDTCDAISGYCAARDYCDPAPYTTPDVEVAALPGAQASLVRSLGQHMPDGLTPTAGALSGAIAHAQALARANPNHRVVVLLATDGLPSECTPTDITGVAAQASAGNAGTPGISTFVIGVFSPAEATSAQSNLDQLAAAGGTGKAFVINTNQNVTQSFVAALNAIRTTAVSCAYQIPTPKDGSALDYFAVNVEFTSGAGKTVTIGNVRDKASCSPTMGGWYYDVSPSNGGKPQTISICDNSCTQLRADPAGRVEVLLGCKTEIIVQ